MQICFISVTCISCPRILLRPLLKGSPYKCSIFWLAFIENSKSKMIFDKYTTLNSTSHVSISHNYTCNDHLFLVYFEKDIQSSTYHSQLFLFFQKWFHSSYLDWRWRHLSAGVASMDCSCLLLRGARSGASGTTRPLIMTTTDCSAGA